MDRNAHDGLSMPLSDLTLSEVRGIVDLWERKREPLKINQAVQSTADLAAILEISEYEVGAMLSAVRKQQTQVEVVPEQKRYRPIPKIWFASPFIAAIAVVAWFLASNPSKGEVQTYLPKPNETRVAPRLLAPPPAPAVVAANSEVPRAVQYIDTRQDVQTNFVVLPSGKAVYLNPIEIASTSAWYTESLVAK